MTWRWSPHTASDYFNVLRSDATTHGGPFLKLNVKPEIVLYSKRSLAAVLVDRAVPAANGFQSTR